MPLCASGQQIVDGEITIALTSSALVVECCKSCAVIRSKPITNAVAKLAGSSDIIIIEAMHSHDDVSEDFRAVRPIAAPLLSSKSQCLRELVLYYCTTFFMLELITRELRSWHNSQANRCRKKNSGNSQRKKMIPSDNQIDVRFS